MRCAMAVVCLCVAGCGGESADLPAGSKAVVIVEADPPLAFDVDKFVGVRAGSEVRVISDPGRFAADRRVTINAPASSTHVPWIGPKDTDQVLRLERRYLRPAPP
jgi:hypothetical protein